MSQHYTLELLGDPPILIQTVNENYQLATDLPLATADILAMLDQQPQPVVYIANLLKLIYEFDEALDGATRTARGKNPIYHHPMMKKLVVVTADEGLTKMYRGLDAPAFGNVHAYIVPTLDEALAEARR